MVSRVCLLFGLVSLLSVGCGDTRPNGTISGTVTLNGQPHGALVTFVNEEGTASAVSDSATGQYTLQSGEGKRFPAGEYRVSVTPAYDWELSEEEDEALREGRADAAAARPTTSIPEKYHRTSTSGLQYTVQQGKNTIDIEL